MFRASSLLSYLLLALSVTGSLGTPAASVQPGTVSLPVKGPISVAAKVKREAARRVASRSDSEGSLDRRQGIAPSNIPNLANDLLGFTAQVGIGSPATEYTLLIDTSHPYTWVGAGQAYRVTSTSVNKGTHVTVTYDQGSFSGVAHTDKITLSSTDYVTGQPVDVASQSVGFDGSDGVFGLAPGQSPTILDSLFSQGKISTKEFGLGLRPSYSDSSNEASYGVLTFGGVDQSQYTGTLEYTARVIGSPDTYWGVYTSISYGGTSFATQLATTIDSLSPYILLPTSAYNSYVQSTGATYDSATGLLKMSGSPPWNMKTIDIHWGGTGGTYSIPTDAQVWPQWANAQIGGDSDHYYLLIQDGGSSVKLGLPFLQRFYLAFDIDTSSVGIATTTYTQDTVSWPPPWGSPGAACALEGSVQACPPNYVCGDFIVGTGGDGYCVMMQPVADNEECFDGAESLGPCVAGTTCTYIDVDYWLCRSPNDPPIETIHCDENYNCTRCINGVCTPIS